MFPVLKLHMTLVVAVFLSTIVIRGRGRFKLSHSAIVLSVSSVCRLSSVCDTHEPWLNGGTFRQHFVHICSS